MRWYYLLVSMLPKPACYLSVVVASSPALHGQPGRVKVSSPCCLHGTISMLLYAPMAW